MTAKVAIVGRPNVGKSTLFNRLVGRRLALVDDRPGVTRDVRHGEARLGRLAFRLADTAGLDEAPEGSLEARMHALSERAIADSDVCLFLIDARAGLTPLDTHFAGLVRKSGKPVVLIANKAEGRAGEAGVLEAHGLGLGEPLALSAEHGEGLGALHDRLAELLEGETDADTGDDSATDGDRQPLRLAIIGRPNAGKSTLVNRLIGEQRQLTGPEAGITRDAIAIDWSWRGRAITLWDTAGMRKKARVHHKLEKLAVADGRRAVRFAEVVVVLFEAGSALEKQDLALADYAASEGRAMVIAINKWDQVKDPAAAGKAFERQVSRLLPQVAGVEVVRLSALTGKGTGALMPAVMHAYEVWNRRIATARLNQWLAWHSERHPPPASAGRRNRLKYITQVRARPPTFVVFCSRPADIPESYRRYLINGLREEFELAGTPIRLQFKSGDNPYARRE